MLPIVTKILGSSRSLEQTQKDLIDVVNTNSLKRLNVQDDFGDTLLIKCCRLDYTLVIDALIEKKVDIDLANNSGLNPILLSLRKDTFELTKQLIEAGCKLEQADQRGQTPLIWISTNKDEPGVTSLLIESGANVNAVDTQKYTPLHLASANNRIETCRVLLQHGAKFDALNNNYFSPFEFAVENRNREITQLFFSTIKSYKDLTYIDKFCYSASKEDKEFIQTDFDNTLLRLRLENNLTVSDKNQKKLKI